MHVPEGVTQPQLSVRAQAPIPTRFGQFEMRVFRWVGELEGEPTGDTGLSLDHVALAMGDTTEAEDLLVRVHSECLTSEVFGSLKCDCRQQLEAAQRTIAKAGRGIVLYLRQEGRGIGLVNKIRAYELQSAGHDTVDANRMLGLPDDARDYSCAAAMLAYLGVRSVRLMTNNPAKVSALESLGVVVTGRDSVIVEPSKLAASYLETKRQRMGHDLPKRSQLTSSEPDEGAPG